MESSNARGAISSAVKLSMSEDKDRPETSALTSQTNVIQKIVKLIFIFQDYVVVAERTKSWRM